MKSWRRISRGEFVAACLLSVFCVCSPASKSQTVKELGRALTTVGARGGLAVWLAGEQDAAEWANGLAELHSGRGFLVLGLHADARFCAGIRDRLAERGVLGGVTVDTLTTRGLPLIDESVNLLVVSTGAPQLAAEDVERVLAPLGTAIVQGGAARAAFPARQLQDGCVAFTKPWPAALDEWTHYMHDASNNAVSHDQRVAPPRHLQWQCGPRWSRHHDHMASVSALVSASGRVFCILDEGSCVSPQLPPDWQLIARDAFNGARLWKRAIPDWHTHLWPLKSGPANLPRRLVAVDDVVYATLGNTAPVSALDGTSGKTLRTYADTAGTEEILVAGDTLLALINRTPMDFDADLAEDSEEGKSRDRRTTYSPTMAKIWAGIRSKRWTHGDRVIRAFSAGTGEALWEKAGTVVPLTLGVGDGGVFFHDAAKIVALDLATGKERWASEPVPVWQGLDGRGLQSWFAPTLVVYGDQVLFAGGEKTHMSYMGWGSKDIGQDTMTALSTRDGSKLWTAPNPYGGYNSPEDLFVSGGKVWVGATAKGGPSGRYIGHDLVSGELAVEYPPDVKTHWFHHRCYRAKATDKYILSSRTGIEFVDLKTGKWSINHWVRGGCLYGIMPANGLVYSPPHPCACYPESKLYGFTALAPEREARSEERGAKSGERLEKGTAYETIRSAVSASHSPSTAASWPMYRHDPARSGAGATRVPAKLRPVWEAALGGRLTQPVVADGRVIVADSDRHTIHALAVATGRGLWSYTAGGRIDSAPTCWRGRVLFGSANGHVYCLRGSDGALMWRFRVAPRDQRMVAFEQVESVWPVHGAVLVQDGVVTALAGRSMFLDGGLHLCRIDVDTGKLLGQTVLDDREPAGEGALQNHIKGLNMPVALPDILSSDGEHLFMRSQTMDLAGNRLKLGPGKSGPDHLFAPYGFTDDSWFHRTYWLFGDAFHGGVGGFRNGQQKPAGRILVTSDTTVFGYGRKPQFYRWASVADYQLYATPRPGVSVASATGGPQALFFANKPSLNPKGKALTVAAWVKPDVDDGTILVRGANAHGFALVLTERKPRMLLRTKGKTHSVVSCEAIGTEWAHVAGVLHDDGRMQVFLDGGLVGTTDGVPLLGGEPMIPMKVGCDDTNQLLPDPLPFYNGALDEVMLFHRALTPAEISALAAPGATLAKEDRDALVLHLPFTAGKTRDSSGAGNHGSFRGGDVVTIDGPGGDALVLTQPKTPADAAALAKRRTARKGSKAKYAYLWTRDTPMMVRAMALARDVLFVAGPPDVLDEEATFQTIKAAESQAQIAAQAAALKGKSGALLQAVSADTGETLGEYKLPSSPAFDGMSVGAGHVFIATTDGRILAYAGE